MGNKAPTSTRTITRLGVLTVLARCGETEEMRAKAAAELESICAGGTHVPAWKVPKRLMERCIIGGQCFGYSVDGHTVVTGGMN
jgi:hypothetical protein